MAAAFNIRSSEGDYEVRLDSGALATTLPRATSDSVVIADPFFAERLRALGVPTVFVPAEESSKSLENLVSVIAELRDLGLSRDKSITAIGGGVVQDVAGFAASIFMRGVAWTYYPTTLLAMADSCIGGKSSINVGRYKNIAGTFHPPRGIVIDPLLCETLGPEQKSAGLIEAAKICFCRGEDSFDRYLQLAKDAEERSRNLGAIVELSLSAKKWFIEVDEFDRAERLQLNLGHTFGHAIEAASKFSISHGLAVGLGVIAATAFSEERGPGSAPQARGSAFRAHIRELLAAATGLETQVRSLSTVALMEAFRADKKHTADRFALILPLPDGGAERVLLPRDEVTERRVEAAFVAMTSGAWQARERPPSPIETQVG